MAYNAAHQQGEIETFDHCLEVLRYTLIITNFKNTLSVLFHSNLISRG